MNWFRRKKATHAVEATVGCEPWPTGPVTFYRAGGGWGCHVNFYKDREPRADGCEEVWGHFTPRPRRGDILTVPMQSGRDMAHRFVEVELCRDPNDMFFGWVERLGYVDEIELPERKPLPDFV